MVAVHGKLATAGAPDHVIPPAFAAWMAPPAKTVCSVSPSILRLVSPRVMMQQTTLKPADSPIVQHRLLTSSTPGKAECQARHSGPTPRQEAVSRGSVSLGNRRFEQLRELGRGSFGVVWEARELPAGSAEAGESKRPAVALKCSKPTSRQMLEACLLEAEILRRLGAVLPQEVATANRVPRYISHCVVGGGVSDSPTGATSGSQGQSKVLVAMSKLEGRPLDQWLYGVDENRLKAVAVSQILEGPFPEGHFGTQDLAGASRLTVELLSQMAPVFASLDGIAYHRDVSAHNFLIRGDVGQAQFALLDFGLAVRASTWQQEFHSRNISGDPRYFTPAAWMLMVYGHKYLKAHPDPSFLQQYKARLDHYSFGLLTLETFFGLWQGPAAEVAASEVPAAAARAKALVRARKAWHALWADAMGFFQMFHGKGHAATREALAGSQAVSKYADKLRALCSELRMAAKAYADAPSDAPAAAVLEIAAGLLDPQGILEWSDLPRLLEPALHELPGMCAEVGKGRGVVAAETDKPTHDSATAESITASPVSDARTSAGAAEEVATDADTSKGVEPESVAQAGMASKPSSADAEAASGGALADGDLDHVRGEAEAATESNAAGKAVTTDKALAAGGAEEAAAATNSKTRAPSRTYVHRRYWTVDGAVSITRGVPEVALGWVAGPPKLVATRTVH